MKHVTLIINRQLTYSFMKSPILRLKPKTVHYRNFKFGKQKFITDVKKRRFFYEGTGF